MDVSIIHPLFLINMMEKSFAYLWIPTISHTQIPFDNPYHKELENNISDIPNEEFKVKLRLHNKDIEVYIQDENNNNAFILFTTLYFVDFSHNGIVKYSFTEASLGEDGFRFTSDTFPEIIYHMIKSFYHIHEFHESESDSSLQPFVSKEDINIHDMDNIAIHHYLESHEEAILNLVKNARAFLQTAKEKELNKKDASIIREYYAFPNMYVMALGYDTYLSSIYNSVYNSKCRISAEKSKYRQRAFNIKNSIKYFHVLNTVFNEKIRETNTLRVLQKAEENLKAITKSANGSLKIGIIGILISLFFGIGSIAYSVYLSNESSEELKKASNELRQSIIEMKIHNDSIQSSLK